MQIREAAADGFTNWLCERTVNLDLVLNRRLAYELTGSRDKTAISIAMHMFSMSNTFTCFADGEFVPRAELCKSKEYAAVSEHILSNGVSALPGKGLVTPNASAEGNYLKMWKYEDGEWWLYKLQSSTATRSEREIKSAMC